MSGSQERFSRKQERHLLRLARKLFLEEHPNPERQGCPGDAVLKSVAYRSKDLASSRAEIDALMDHLLICSPCFREFSAYRRSARMRRRVPGLLGLAGCLVLLIVLLYAKMFRPPSPPRERPIIAERPGPPVYQTVSLDLKNRSRLRTEEPQDVPPRESDLQLPRGPLALIILLPLGSEEGAYEIRLARRGQEPILTGKGRAQMQNGTTVLQVKIDTSALESGRYLLGIRQEGWAWVDYPAVLK